MAKGKAIHLSQGQVALGAQRQQETAYEAPLQPTESDWEPPAGGTPHPQWGLFPYDSIRDGQKRFTRDATMAIARRKHLVAEAPTGIGKTAASLAPALQYAIENDKTVLFLTSRQSQHRIAVDTLRQIQVERGARFMVVDLVSKRDMCLRPEAAEMHPGRFPDFCAYETRTKSCKYLGDVDEDTLRQVRDGVLHTEELMKISKDAMLCPHLVATTASTRAQVVVADYNHLFSDIRDRSLEKLGIELQNVIVIVDEAHNLPDRIRQNHAHRITQFLLDNVETEAKQQRFKDIQGDVQALRRALSSMAAKATSQQTAEKRGDAHIQRLEVTDLHDAFSAERNGGTLGMHRTLQDVMDDLQPLITKLRKQSDATIYAEQLAQVLDDWGRFQTGALRYLQWDDDGTTLHLRLLDPGVPARAVFNAVHNAIFMSGTLRPPETIRDLLGLEAERTQVKTYANPFPPEHRLTLIAKGVSTRYKDRSADMWLTMGRYIAELCAAAKGNVALFTPSYEILRELKVALDPFDVEKELIEEQQGMSKQERNQVLDRLRGAKKQKGALLLGVLGGSFSEGVDYPDNLLSAVIVAGLPLPPPDLEVDAAIGYFEKRFPGKGRLYAYIVPAMQKTVQAMGRAIRGPNDKCVTLLLDFRYQQQPYRGFLPDQAAATQDPSDAAARFLQAHDL